MSTMFTMATMLFPDTPIISEEFSPETQKEWYSGFALTVGSVLGSGTL